MKRKFLIPLLLLCPATASAQLRHGPEHRVAPLTLRQVAAGGTVVPTASGYIAFWTTRSTLAQVPIA